MFAYPFLAAQFKMQHKRKKFTTEEDQKLLRLVDEFGKSNWAAISEKMPGRNPRQVRDRYVNYLSPDVVNGPWTQKEDDLLLSKFNEYGSSWKRIASFFPTRTDINVKSRYQKLIRRQRKLARKAAAMRPAFVPQVMPPPKAIEPPAQPISTLSSDDTDIFDDESENIWSTLLVGEAFYDECY